MQCDPQACEVHAAESAAQLSGVQNAPQPFANPRCSVMNDVLVCACDAAVRATSEVCALSDRFGGCLYLPSEFPGCQVGSDAACAAVCGDIQLRGVSAASQALEVVVRASACVGAECRYVLAVDQRCYLAEPLTPVDCAVADAALLSQ
ncbi:MAG: hypothetical protein RJA70_602 [Pseudomonadota bacterium]